MDRKPKSLFEGETFESLTNERVLDVAEDVAWTAILDVRYLCEVQRTTPYHGILCVFDFPNERKLVYEKEVGISYDAIFGPDTNDVKVWEVMVMQAIDDSIQ